MFLKIMLNWLTASGPGVCLCNYCNIYDPGQLTGAYDLGTRIMCAAHVLYVKDPIFYPFVTLYSSGAALLHWSKAA